MPLTATEIGVPTGPLLGDSSTDMSMEKAVWVKARLPYWTTTSWANPKSSGAEKRVANRPAPSVFSRAIS